MGAVKRHEKGIAAGIGGVTTAVGYGAARKFTAGTGVAPRLVQLRQIAHEGPKTHGAPHPELTKVLRTPGGRRAKMKALTDSPEAMDALHEHLRSKTPSRGALRISNLIHPNGNTNPAIAHARGRRFLGGRDALHDPAKTAINERVATTKTLLDHANPAHTPELHRGMQGVEHHIGDTIDFGPFSSFTSHPKIAHVYAHEAKKSPGVYTLPKGSVKAHPIDGTGSTSTNHEWLAGGKHTVTSKKLVTNPDGTSHHEYGLTPVTAAPQGIGPLSKGVIITVNAFGIQDGLIHKSISDMYGGPNAKNNRQIVRAGAFKGQAEGTGAGVAAGAALGAGAAAKLGGGRDAAVGAVLGGVVGGVAGGIAGRTRGASQAQKDPGFIAKSAAHMGEEVATWSGHLPKHTEGAVALRKVGKVKAAPPAGAAIRDGLRPTTVGKAFTKKGRAAKKERQRLISSLSPKERRGAGTLGVLYTAKKAPKGKKLKASGTHMRTLNSRGQDNLSAYSRAKAKHGGFSKNVFGVEDYVVTKGLTGEMVGRAAGRGALKAVTALKTPVGAGVAATGAAGLGLGAALKSKNSS
jgi:hypothetical protein